MSYVNERELILEKATNYFKNNNIDFDILAGGETAGIPYATFLSNKLKKPMIYIRKNQKDLELINKLKENFKKNNNAILIEDLATDGGSKIIL